MLSLCGDAGALGTARDALGDRCAELVQGGFHRCPGGGRECGGMRRSIMAGTADRWVCGVRMAR